eukprot:IDg12318t1
MAHCTADSPSHRTRDTLLRIVLCTNCLRRGINAQPSTGQLTERSVTAGRDRPATRLLRSRARACRDRPFQSAMPKNRRAEGRLEFLRERGRCKYNRSRVPTASHAATWASVIRARWTAELHALQRANARVRSPRRARSREGREKRALYAAARAAIGQRCEPHHTRAGMTAAKGRD